MELNIIIPLFLVVIGFILIITELFIGLDSLFDLVLSGSALLIAGTVGYIIPSWPVSLGLSFILLISYWLLGRNYIHKLIATNPRMTNSDKLIGKTSTITRVRDDGKMSFAKFDGEEWSVESEDLLDHGSKVEVVKVMGSVLEVKVIK